MRPLRPALSVALVFAFLASCSAGSNVPSAPAYQPVSVMPQWIHPYTSVLSELQQPFVYESSLKAGIYAAEFDGPDVLGYHNPNRHDLKAACRIRALAVNGFSVDSEGNLIVPSGATDKAGDTTVSVYSGPDLCGKRRGSFRDPYGEASDAASLNAVKGTIVVANIEENINNKAGNIALCTLAKGCKEKLTSPTITYYAGGVALAKNGDCWITSEKDASFSGARLTFFKGCKGSGKGAILFRNRYYGGLIVDKAGNLVSIDCGCFDNSPMLWVYKGCDPKCRRIGGPFKLKGVSLYGGLNAAGDELAVGDEGYGQVDVYRYGPKKLIYEYSFNKGLGQPSLLVEAAGFSPTL
jgi:hypothetical protein